MRLCASLAALLLSFIAVPAMAECGKLDASEGVSEEAMNIIWQRSLARVAAEEKINKETTQQLLGRMFNLETGKLKNLPPTLMAQYRKDAEYFVNLLRKEASEARARGDAVFAKLDQPCPTPIP